MPLEPLDANNNASQPPKVDEKVDTPDLDPLPPAPPYPAPPADQLLYSLSEDGPELEPDNPDAPLSAADLREGIQKLRAGQSFTHYSPPEVAYLGEFPALRLVFQLARLIGDSSPQHNRAFEKAVHEIMTLRHRAHRAADLADHANQLPALKHVLQAARAGHDIRPVPLVMAEAEYQRLQDLAEEVDPGAAHQTPASAYYQSLVRDLQLSDAIELLNQKGGRKIDEGHRLAILRRLPALCTAAAAQADPLEFYADNPGLQALRDLELFDETSAFVDKIFGRRPTDALEKKESPL